jgi:hypothetical protein
MRWIPIAAVTVLLLAAVCYWRFSIPSELPATPLPAHHPHRPPLPAPSSHEPRRPQATSALNFVPLGDFPAATLTKLAAYYRQKHKLTVKILPVLKPDSSVMDTKGHQLIAENLIALMHGHLASLGNNPQAVVIGLTTGDIYTRKEAWNYAFAIQEGNFAVVSSARMVPVNYGPPRMPGYWRNACGKWSRSASGS